MIDSVEQLLVHWGDSYRLKGAISSGVRCALNTDGQPKARTYNNQGLAMMYSVRLDEVAEAVDVAIASLVKPVSQGGLGEKAGNELKKLVNIRYLVDPMPTLDQQLRRLKYKSKTTYFAKLHQLHSFIESRINKLC